MKKGRRKNNRKTPYKRYNKNGNRGRHNNRRHNHHDNDDDYENVLYVSQNSEAKPVAGKLNSIVLEGDAPQIYMMGNEATNVAVKAVAISRQNIRPEKIDLLVQPRFQRAEGSGPERDSYIFALRKGPTRMVIEPTDEMKISGSGDAGVIAGAISKKIASGERIALSCIGASAVNIAVKSVVIARKYMLDDAMDIGFRPEFAHFEIKGEEKVGIRFLLFASQS